MPKRLLSAVLLPGCAMSGGSGTYPSTMRSLYGAQCRKGSSFACQRAAELRPTSTKA